MNYKQKISALAMIVMTFSCNAEDYVNVDTTRLKWQITPNGMVYFRNLNEFNPVFQACCYNYWIDTNSSTGKNSWAMLMLKIAQGQIINLSVPNAAIGGPINLIGQY